VESRLLQTGIIYDRKKIFIAGPFKYIFVWIERRKKRIFKSFSSEWKQIFERKQFRLCRHIFWI